MSEFLKTGTVKKFSVRRGFGFIQEDSRDDVDYFFHWLEIKTKDNFKILQPGEKVIFDVQDHPRGMRAVNIHRIPESSSVCAEEMKIDSPIGTECRS